MPAYNEEAIVGQTIRRVLGAFGNAGIPLQLVVVDNGSRDRTGEIIRQLAQEHPQITPVRVEKNVGYGSGILSGIPACVAPWVGVIPADGQVDAEDAVRLFEDAVASGLRCWPGAAGFGWRSRKVVSIAYNLFFRSLFPGVQSMDINGLPKLMPREVILRMELTSKQWLLDPEIMIKANYLGVRVLEYNCFARMRGNGLSHVKATTCWEFFAALLRFRFSGEFSAWRRRVGISPTLTARADDARR
jgi:glycosyltransferase involved in cell wall biosynthesis